jgi:hypothetical protein
LQSIKEKLIAADVINQLDIADGLKELLISIGFTLRLLLKTSTSELGKTLALMSIGSLYMMRQRKSYKVQD